jgi:hypothetical protein
VSLGLGGGGAFAWGQDEIERPAPPPRDDLELDANKDGIPDGWYNALDATIEATGGVAGPRFVRFRCEKRGRIARLSRAFGVDGRKTQAIILGLWIRLGEVEHGDRVGTEPSLAIDFLGDNLRHETRGMLGPWTHTVGNRWTRVAKRIPVPPTARDAIMSVGLVGAKGVLDVDGLTIDLVPVGEASTTNLVVNGDFELGDPQPACWLVNGDARRAFPGHDSQASIELPRAGSRVLTNVALRVDALGSLKVSAFTEAKGLRGSGGAHAGFFFLDQFGLPLAGHETGDLLFEWSGSYGWRASEGVVRVPRGAATAVLQFEKTDNLGVIRIDDVQVTAAPNAEVGEWSPYHVTADTDTWLPLPPLSAIAPGSALDFSFLVPRPAGRNGFVALKNGRLTYARGGRARFHGVSLLPPTAFLEPEQSDTLADRLARSGINLVRLGELDTPLGPRQSLLDDTRDDTRAFDPVALGRLDHLIAALESRGISVALELQGSRNYRVKDDVEVAGLLPPGGGPAALFDPKLTELARQTAHDLLTHINGETKRALKDDPALAWVTLLGEISLFNRLDDPGSLPAPYADELRKLAQKSNHGSGARFWESVESSHFAAMAEALRKDGLRVPIAGSSHWRRDPEYASGLAAPGLELVDDRIYWTAPIFADPEFRSQLWSADGAMAAASSRKRQAGLAYAVGQWCSLTKGVWALPHEAADMLLAARLADVEDWDALVRRGVFLYPDPWGKGPTGTGGGEDIFQLAEVANASPQVYALWPHVSSLLLRGTSAEAERGAAAHARHRGRGALPGWDPARGRLVVDTPFTQGMAGWFGGQPVTCADVEVSADNPFAVVVVSSAGKEPIKTAKRLLVTVIGRVQPTGFCWVDQYRREAADPGRPPLLQEPILARVTWRREGSIKGYVLNGDGERAGGVKLETLPDGGGATLLTDGKTAAFHWELTAE